MKVLLSSFIVLLFASAAQATPITYKAVLSGANENPAVITAGTGLATVIYDDITHLLSLDVAFSGLTGTTTASHIHCCQVPPTNAGIATTTPTFAGFPLGVTAGTYVNTLNLTLASSFSSQFVGLYGGIAQAEAALAAGLANGQSYFNIHTSFAPGGEIRGTLVAVEPPSPVPVPEPASLTMLGLGLTGLAGRRLRRRA